MGGVSASARATGIARSTIGRGLKDLDEPAALSGVVRRPGGGRRSLPVIDATLLEDLRQLLEPAVPAQAGMGDPMRLLLWVSKSHAKLAVALRAKGHKVSKSSSKRSKNVGNPSFFPCVDSVRSTLCIMCW